MEPKAEYIIYKDYIVIDIIKSKKKTNKKKRKT